MPLDAATIEERARNIQLVLFDVDGVLTDGTLTYGPGGEALKTFHVRDGHGIVLLRLAGVRSGILSARDSEIVRARMRELGVTLLSQGQRDKTVGLKDLLARSGVDASAVAFMGDDVNDLPVLTQVGLSAAPADAEPEVLDRVDFVASRVGGKGAARDLCDLILRARGLIRGSP
jgi:3-deoxy-D-manno-octulosonate 8-phosphate phosphatase (KDO 8-P phosphatase)